MIVSRLAMKQACALLAASGIGAGSVVTTQAVQKQRPAVAEAVAKPAARPMLKRVSRPVAQPQPRAKPERDECATGAAPILAGFDAESSLPGMQPSPEDAQPRRIADAGMPLPDLVATRAPGAFGRGAPAGPLGGPPQVGTITAGLPGGLPGASGGPPASGGAVVRAGLSPGGMSVVPEPTMWALMIAGFGIVGWALRYRRGNALPVTMA